VDRLKLPLQLVMFGCVAAIVRALTNTALAWLARPSSYSMLSYMSVIQLVFAVAVGGLLAAGCASIASQKRPGHQLAMGAAIAFGVNIMFSFAFLSGGALRSSGFTVLGILQALVGAGAAIALALALRELGKSRERNVDPLVFTAAGIAAFGLLLSITSRLGLHLGDLGRYLSIVLTIAEYGALIGAATRIMSGVTPGELVMADGTAYRGPQGAYTLAPEGPPGSMALGFMAGFFGGCIGLGLVLALAKGPATKRGAGIGFACQTVIGIVLRAAAH
jgi:hypothetical protein